MAYKVPSGWQSKADARLRDKCNVHIYVGSIGPTTLICDKSNISSFKYRGTASWIAKDIPTHEIVFTILKWTNYNYKASIDYANILYLKYVLGGLETTGFRTYKIYDMEYDYNKDTMTVYAQSKIATLTSAASYTLGQDTTTILQTMLAYTFNALHITRSFNADYMPFRVTRAELIQQIALCNYSSFYEQDDEFYMESYEELNPSRTYSELNIMNVISAFTKSISDIPTTINIGTWFNETTLVDLGTVSYVVPLNPTPANIYITMPYQSQYYTIATNCTVKRGSTTITPTTLTINNTGVTARIMNPVAGATYYLSVKAYAQVQENKQEQDQLTFTTPLLSDGSLADTVKTKTSIYYALNKMIEFDCRIDPAIEPLDLLYISDKDIFIYVEKVEITFNGAFNGFIRGRDAELTIQPLRVDNIEYDPYDEDYAFRIHNDNLFPVKVKIHYSGGTIDMGVVGAKTYKDVSNISCPQLLQSFRAKDMQDLNDDVYCYCEKGNLTSTNTIILEAD